MIETESQNRHRVQNIALEPPQVRVRQPLVAELMSSMLRLIPDNFLGAISWSNHCHRVL